MTEVLAYHAFHCIRFSDHRPARITPLAQDTCSLKLEGKGTCSLFFSSLASSHRVMELRRPGRTKRPASDSESCASDHAAIVSCPVPWHHPPKRSRCPGIVGWVNSVVAVVGKSETNRPPKYGKACLIGPFRKRFIADRKMSCNNSAGSWDGQSLSEGQRDSAPGRE